MGVCGMVWVLGGGMCRLLECMLGELPSAGGTGVQGCGLENGGVLPFEKKKEKLRPPGWRDENW